MHHNVLLIAAGLICSPVFAAPNINNRPNPPRRVHRPRQAPAPILSVDTPFRAPIYESSSEFVSLDDDSTRSAPADSTSAVIVDPLTPIPVDPTSACSVIKITEYVTVYDTASSTSSPANLTSAPYGWNSSTIFSGLLTGTGILVTTTSQPYFPITNSTTSTLFGTAGTGAPTFANITSSAVLPPNNTLSPSNFTSFPNTTTPALLPTSAVGPTLNFTSFVNVSTTPYLTPTPLSANFTSFPNASSTPEISILPVPASSSGNVSSIPSPSSPRNVSSIPFPSPSSNVSPIPSPSPSGNVSFIPSTAGLTVTSIIVSGTYSSTTTFTSLIIDTNIPPMETASPSVSSTSPSLVIVTTVTPIATASSMPPEFPTTIITASGTVSSAGPSGTPSIHCGIHGSAMGVYYLATYAYNRANTPVTLQGCYQFCAVAVERCYSYEFYLEPGLGSPRCKLYGGLVAYELDSVDPYQPNQWFDVACGDPTKYV